MRRREGERERGREGEVEVEGWVDGRGRQGGTERVTVTRPATVYVTSDEVCDERRGM